MRLFVGSWPPESVIHGLAQTRHQLAEAAPRRCLRFTATEQLHLSLRFLGDVDDTRVPRLMAALSEQCAALPAVAVTVSGIGVFPDLQRPRVLWAGVNGDLPGLGQLHAAVARAVEAVLENAEGKSAEPDFHPHLTLARVNEIRSPERRILRRALAEIPGPAELPWVVDHVRLIRSELHSNGARYSVLHEIPLATTR